MNPSGLCPLTVKRNKCSRKFQIKLHTISETRKSGVIKIIEKRCSSSSSSYSNEPNFPRPLTFTQEAINQMDTACDVEEKMLWLENCCDPWQTVELYWELTSKSRISLLATQNISIAQYPSPYKALKEDLSGGIDFVSRNKNALCVCVCGIVAPMYE